MKLSDQTVVVITGAGSGVGRGLAVECVRRGCALVLVDHQGQRLHDVGGSLEPNKRISRYEVDVGNEPAMLEIAESVSAQFGRVDVLINCAGVSVAAPFQELSQDDFRWLMQTNFWGVVFGCRAFLPALCASPHGTIANILSDFAVLGFPTKTAYCASKFAVRGFAKSLRAELRSQGVAVTNIYLGPVETNLIRDAHVWDERARAAEHAFVVRHAISMKRVVNGTLRAIERRKGRAVIGGVTRGVDWIARMAPVLSNTLLARYQHRIPFLHGQPN